MSSSSSKFSSSKIRSSRVAHGNALPHPSQNEGREAVETPMTPGGSALRRPGGGTQSRRGLGGRWLSRGDMSRLDCPSPTRSVSGQRTAEPYLSNGGSPARSSAAHIQQGTNRVTKNPKAGAPGGHLPTNARVAAARGSTRPDEAEVWSDYEEPDRPDVSARRATKVSRQRLRGTARAGVHPDGCMVET